MHKDKLLLRVATLCILIFTFFGLRAYFRGLDSDSNLTIADREHVEVVEEKLKLLKGAEIISTDVALYYSPDGQRVTDCVGCKMVSVSEFKLSGFKIVKIITPYDSSYSRYAAMFLFQN